MADKSTLIRPFSSISKLNDTPRGSRIVQSHHQKTKKWAVGGSEVKASASNTGDLGSIPGLGKSMGWEDPLEKEMSTHSSILAWRIPWTEEPGGLQSMGSQRVGHD